MNGCFNREPFPKTVEMIDGMENAWLPHKVEVPFAFTNGCNYATTDLGKADGGCHGCQWRAPEGGTGSSGEARADEHSICGVLNVEGASDGVERSADVERAARAAEQRAYLESLWPEAALYQPTEEK